MIVRRATLQDLKSIVSVHMERFENFFLSSLGEHFLKVYYNAFISQPGILLVLEDEGRVKGFASGSPSNKGFYKKILSRNIVSFTAIGMKLLLTKPKAIYRIFTNMKTSSEEDQVFAELLSIATVKNNKGYGSTLLDAFEAEVKKIKKNNTVDSLSLTTDFNDNTKAIEFYKSKGYKELSIFESYDKRKMYRFIKKL